MKGYIITHHCRIRNHTVVINETEGFRAATTDFSDFMRSVYNHYQIDYPKFFKMDNLSKLGFITAALLLKNSDLSLYAPEEIGVVMANNSSCLDTDERYYNTIKDNNDYFPSPSVFVYTLPNIMMGEICIKYHIKGENAFFVFDSMDADFLFHYTHHLLETNKVQSCIIGWVNLYHDQYEAILYLVEKQDNPTIDSIIFNTENLNKLYLDKQHPHV